MKKYFIIYVLLILGLFSCGKDFLDEEVRGKISPQSSLITREVYRRL